MSISAKANWVILDLSDYFCELAFTASLSKFLGQVVAEWVIH